MIVLKWVLECFFGEGCCKCIDWSVKYFFFGKLDWFFLLIVKSVC